MVSVGDAVRIAITGDGTQAISEFNKVGASAKKNLKDAESSGKSFGTTLTKVGVGMIGTGAAIGAGLFEAAKAASEADLAQQKLLNTIHNAPQLVGASTKAFNEQADALEKTTVYSHVQTTTIQAMLGQYKATQSQILELTPLVEDFASKFGIDTTAAAKAVGKALEGTAGGLQRYGIVTGITKKTTDDFNRVVGALRGTVGGFATQEGRTFTGQLTIAKNEMKHVEEEIGAGAIPVIRQLGGIVGTAAHGFLNMDAATGGAVGKIAAYGAAGLIAVGTTNVLIGSGLKFAANLSTLAIKLGIKTAATEADAVATAANAVATEADAAAMDTLAVSSLAALGPIGLLAGAWAGGLVALGVFSKDANETSLSTKALESAFDGAAKGAHTFADAVQAGTFALQGEARAELEKWLADTKGAVPTLQAAGVSWQDYYSAITQGGPAYDRVKSKLDAYLQLVLWGHDHAHPFGYSPADQSNARLLVNNLENSAGAYRTASTAGKFFASTQTDDVVHAQQLADQSIVKVNHHIQDGRDSYVGYSRAALEAALAQRTTNSAVDDGSTAINAYNEQILKLIGLEQTAAGDQRAAREDYLRVGDAVDTVTQDQKAYTDAVKAHGAASSEAQSALRKEQEDILAVGDAVDTASQAMVKAAATQSGYVIGGKNSARATNDFIWSLQQMAAQTNGPVHAALEALIGKLQAVKSPPPVKIEVDTADASTALASWLNGEAVALANGLSFSLTGSKSGNNIDISVQHHSNAATKQFALGGWVDGAPGAPVPAVVHGGEYVLSRDMLAGRAPIRGLGGAGHGGVAGGGATYNITVNALDPASAARAVVDAIRVYNRNHGAAPIKVAA